MDGYNEDFWNALDELVSNSEIVIDRPRGSAHPRFPNFIYKVDYGYLKDTASMDGSGIDVWVGSGDKKIDATKSLTERRKNNKKSVVKNCEPRQSFTLPRLIFYI